MKTAIVLKNKSFIEQISENISDFGFKQYAFFHTLVNNPKQLGNAYWSNTDCYIRIGKSGYISNGKIIDINGDITELKELIINTPEQVKINLSEPEFSKIKQLAEEKHISIKDILMLGIEKLQTTDL